MPGGALCFIRVKKIKSRRSIGPVRHDDDVALTPAYETYILMRASRKAIFNISVSPARSLPYHFFFARLRAKLPKIHANRTGLQCKMCHSDTATGKIKFA